ncbi:Beta-galactosidase, domain 3 [Rhizoctonia solani]|uniref:Beta-galactosidase n=1 Tax=Rhizoctonia solani TaxID=456999 RepID=A0A8H7IKH0_9AGAM|nr:Beta-galactosidase, domain 3 [Rhizoctonia solani]
MRLSRIAVSTALLAQSLVSAGAVAPRATPLASTGYTDAVQWDKYSLFVHGQRVFVWSGEFHPWRLPVPSLWPDIFQKMKAAGFNTVSIYIHWGTISPSKDVIDMNHYRDVKPIFEAAKAAGIFLIYRPGPYINAETSAGGIPHWVTTEVQGHLRTNASDYAAAWAPYVKAVSEAVKGYQVNEGGPVVAIQIENEYPQPENTGNPGKAGMMADLQAAVRKYGVVVPTTFNDAGMDRNYVSGLGKVDLYGLDSYFNGFDCRNTSHRSPVVENYYDYHLSSNPNTPHFIPEFQSGSLDPWGPDSPGLDSCYNMTGPDYLDVAHKNLWAQNVKMFNAYMLYGGTSWGHLPFHKGYTSYDNGASIRENRRLSTKYTEFKKQGLFLRNAPEFYKTDIVGNSTSGAVAVSDPAAFVTELRNPDTKAGFYIARQTYSPSTANLVFKLTVKASSNSIPVQITLAGRQSKVIVADFAFGSSRALYSTAAIFFAGKLNGRDVLFLHGDTGVEHSAAVKLSGTPKIGGNRIVTASTEPSGYTVLTFKPTTEGLTAISSESTGPLVLFATSRTIGTFWQPTINTGKGNYWQFDTNSTLLVGGPYLVRSADIKGNTVALTGDLEKDTTVSIYGAPKGSKVTWNGKSVSVSASSIVDGLVEGKVTISKGQVNVPTLSNWKYSDSLPEIAPNYDDSKWIVANHTTTNSPYKPYYGDGRILYGCDYGYCEGPVFWRGHFNATGAEKSVNLSINGGEAFAASVWLNGKFVKTTYGKSTYPAYIWPIIDPAIEETDEVFTFPKGALVAGKNVITVLQDNTGLNETNDWNGDTSKSPRGIRGFQLPDGGKFGEWKVQGKLGGYTKYASASCPPFPHALIPSTVSQTRPAECSTKAVCTASEQGGTSQDSTPSLGPRALSTRDYPLESGVGFFRTEFNLNIPSGKDVHMSFVVGGPKGPYRAVLFVNGWTMGKVASELGPQYKFPVHEGILNYQGKNTVAFALWVLEDQPVKPTLSLAVDGVYDGGVGKIELTNPGWTSRGTVV